MDEQMLLKYDGPALKQHRMDVRDLAPALMGLADAIQVAGKSVSPDADVRLDIQANKEGSFEIEMLISAASDLGVFMAGVWMTATANGITLAGAISKAVTGAVSIAARVARHSGKPQKVEESEDGTQVKVKYPDGTILETYGMAWIVYENGKAMAGLEKMVKPLNQGSIDSVSIAAGDDAEDVNHDEREGFIPSTSEEIVTDNTIQMVLEIEDLRFKKDTWRVSDGKNTLTVEIEDRDFLDRVKTREITFSSGDALHADVRVVQRRVNGKIQPEYTVLRVREVMPSTD